MYVCKSRFNKNENSFSLIMLLLRIHKRARYQFYKFQRINQHPQKFLTVLGQILQNELSTQLI